MRHQGPIRGKILLATENFRKLNFLRVFLFFLWGNACSVSLWNRRTRRRLILSPTSIRIDRFLEDNKTAIVCRSMATWWRSVSIDDVSVSIRHWLKSENLVVRNRRNDWNSSPISSTCMVHSIWMFISSLFRNW